MKLLALPTPAGLGRIGGALARGGVELLVLVGGKPGPVRDLAGSFVGCAQVREVLDPASPLGCLQDMAQPDDFVMEGAARRPQHLDGTVIEVDMRDDAAGFFQ